MQLVMLKLQNTSASCGAKGESLRKVKSRKRRQRSSIPEEQECWASSSGSNYVPDDVLGDNDGNVSLAKEEDVDLHGREEMESSRRQCDERKRIPVEGKERYKRCMVVRDVVVIEDDPEIGVLIGLDPILHGKVTLDIVIDFVSKLGPVHVEAIKGTVLKAILQYCSFGLRKELTLAPIKIRGRLVPFTVFDVAFMTGLPTTGRRVEFDGEKEVSGDLGRMVRERIPEIVAAKKGSGSVRKKEGELLEPVNKVQLNGRVILLQVLVTAWCFRLYVWNSKLEKESHKLAEKEAEMLAYHVHDLECRLQKHEDIHKYFKANNTPSATDHEGGVPTADDVHSTNEHHLQSAKVAATYEQ
ncbi:hypothetical protein Cgig2_032102 [Carnegiea gigantea]|uniref:Uncharacterized protein n=1 Tax=Carnegiea gigantea TaxID=171969 RepID=A0A9Q1GRL3_9CARY|nr:hypothetical protein Cgig2_032102 [Carnegiea gigantea]